MTLVDPTQLLMEPMPRSLSSTRTRNAPRKSHGAYNLAGCVSLKVQEASLEYPHKTLVGVWASYESGMESDPETPWTTSCEGHSTLVCSNTRENADGAHTTDFCDECREGLPPTYSTDAWHAYKTHTQAGKPRKRILTEV